MLDFDGGGAQRRLRYLLTFIITDTLLWRIDSESMMVSRVLLPNCDCVGFIFM